MYVARNLDKYKLQVAKIINNTSTHDLLGMNPQFASIRFNIYINGVDSAATHYANRQMWCSQLQQFLHAHKYLMITETTIYNPPHSWNNMKDLPEIVCIFEKK